MSKVSSVVIAACAVIGLVFSVISFARNMRSCSSSSTGGPAKASTTSRRDTGTQDVDLTIDDAPKGDEVQHKSDGGDVAEPYVTSFGPGSGSLNELDAHGNLKARTLLFTKGSLLSNQLKGWRYSTPSRGTAFWQSSDAGCTLSVYVGEDSHAATTDEFERMLEGGAGRPTCFSLTVSGYGNVAAALEACEAFIPECTVFSNEQACGIAENLDHQFFLTATLTEDKTVCIQIFNDRAIQAGVMGEYGTTMEDAYEGFVNS